jgi:hypothetical protein
VCVCVYVGVCVCVCVCVCVRVCVVKTGRTISAKDEPTLCVNVNAAQQLQWIASGAQDGSDTLSRHAERRHAERSPHR